jgi:hypothetical protein
VCYSLLMSCTICGCNSGFMGIGISSYQWVCVELSGGFGMLWCNFFLIIWAWLLMMEWGFKVVGYNNMQMQLCNSSFRYLIIIEQPSSRKIIATVKRINGIKLIIKFILSILKCPKGAGLDPLQWTFYGRQSNLKLNHSIFYFFLLIWTVLHKNEMTVVVMSQEENQIGEDLLSKGGYFLM